MSTKFRRPLSSEILLYKLFLSIIIFSNLIGCTFISSRSKFSRMNILLIAVSCNQYDDLRSEISRYSNVFMLFALQHLSLQKDSKELVDKTFRISLENTVNNFNSFFDELCRYSRLNTRHVNIKELGVYCDKKLCSFLVLHELMIKDFEKINNGNDEYIKNLRKLTDKFISENFHGYSVIYKNAKQDVEYKRFEVKSDNLVDMIDKIIQMWSTLYKTVDNGKQVKNSTLIIPRNSFTIPGGRFREVYYWDSYWIFDGQLALGMDKIVLEGLENFVELIEKFGFIPNGNRLYYTKRSQPPYFTQMVSNYYKNATQIPLDRQKIEIYVNAMIIEYNFWMNARKCSFLHNNKRYVMNQYRVTTDYPRPEALTEDIETFKEYLAKVEKCKLSHKTIETILDGYKKGLPYPFKYAEKENMIYGNIKSAAESGWDFSTRFFSDGVNFYTICTRDIIPVDLNAILYSNEVIIAEFLEKVNDARSKYFREAADTRKKLINDVFWKDGSWRDYNYVKQKHHRDSFYFSNLYPMIYGIEPPEGNVYDIMYKYRKVLFGYKGGIPASDQEISDQQWDFPNVWAPHQHLFADFLLRIGEYDLANHVAALFYRAIKSCIKGKAYVFYERYKCDTLGKPGRSGEYPVQDGFGWTNGVITRFIKIFGDKIIVSEKNHAKEYETIVEYLKTKLSGAKTETDTCKNTRKCLQTENPRLQRDIRPHGS